MHRGDLSAGDALGALISCVQAALALGCLQYVRPAVSRQRDCPTRCVCSPTWQGLGKLSSRVRSLRGGTLAELFPAFVDSWRSGHGHEMDADSEASMRDDDDASIDSARDDSASAFASGTAPPTLPSYRAGYQLSDVWVGQDGSTALVVVDASHQVEVPTPAGVDDEDGANRSDRTAISNISGGGGDDSDVDDNSESDDENGSDGESDDGGGESDATEEATDHAAVETGSTSSQEENGGGEEGAGGSTPALNSTATQMWAEASATLSFPPSSVTVVFGAEEDCALLRDLLLGLARPAQGRVTIDSEDVADQPTDWVRSNVGFVPSHPVVYTATALDNVSLGPPSTVAHLLDM